MMEEIVSVSPHHIRNNNTTVALYDGIAFIDTVAIYDGIA